ncbi:DUF1702 family protein [Catellatospora tritici]|uniref:DUF1702 family protein n=1 Tax=Catellatospora tritici TaxID=2851566 RepID=UPI001C2CF428|nr:DUF1702 family protein [Catellatospora tritici]MBV1849289.1 DUF1702 family protein [Catellatospora tritici]
MSVYRALRRRILTPDMKATRLDVRGFHVKDEASRDMLETVGRSFLTGYAYAAEARRPLDAEQPLEELPTRYKGFAYEGAGMGFAIRDGLPIGGGKLVEDFLDGRADDHVYMIYVGVGWAMARLPRFRWKTLYAADPLLKWLILDGYGFHQAYFQTEKYVYDQYVEENFPWPGGEHNWYANRVIDQGIGRACWFVGGTEAEVAAGLIDRFPVERRADMYAGMGLAATYAGGADPKELEELWQHAADYRRELAQGAAFAAGARERAGLTVPHNEVATKIFCDMSPQEAQLVTIEALIDLPMDGDIPIYEVWRRRIADRFVANGHC